MIKHRQPLWCNFLKNTKIILVLLLLLSIMVWKQGSFLYTQEDEYFSFGQGTAEKPFLLKTKEDLMILSQLVNQNMMPYVSAYYRLENDLKLAENYQHTPIGNARYEEEILSEPKIISGTPFRGVFDGNGKLLSGFLLKAFGTSQQSHAGFFGVLAGASVFDLTFEHASITNVSDSRYSTTGILAGRSLNSFISNVSIKKSRVRGHDNVGGLVGIQQAVGGKAELLNSHSEIIVAGRQRVGGLAGQNYAFTKGSEAVIQDSSASGEVVGRSRVGGLVGGNYANMGLARITNSQVTVQVIATRKCAFAGTELGFFNRHCNSIGGLVGNHYAVSGGVVEITSSQAIASVTGETDVGGLVGKQYSDDATARITKSSAKGVVTGRAYVGGLIGVVHVFSPYEAYTPLLPTPKEALAAKTSPLTKDGLGGGFISAVTTGGTVSAFNSGGGLIGGVDAMGSANFVLKNALVSMLVESEGTMSGLIATVYLRSTSTMTISRILFNGKLRWRENSGLFSRFLTMVKLDWFNQKMARAIIGDLNYFDFSSAQAHSVYWNQDNISEMSTSSGFDEQTVISDVSGKSSSELKPTDAATGLYEGWDSQVWDFRSSQAYPSIIVN